MTQWIVDPETAAAVVAALHAHAHRISVIEMSLEPLRQFLHAPSSYHEMVRREEALRLALNGLRGALRSMLGELEDTWRDRDIPAHIWEQWGRVADELDQHLSRGEAPAGQRPLLHALLGQLAVVEPARLELNIGRERARGLAKAANEVRRLLCGFDAFALAEHIREAHHELRAIADFAMGASRAEGPKQPMSLKLLLESVVRDQRLFAMSKNIDLRSEVKLQDVEVLIDVPWMIRALVHVLNNAIKYSYTMEPTVGRPWIIIRARRQDQTVVVEFESWGTPIATDELRDDRLFRIGQRGTFAGRDGRRGNGIGLAEAKRVISAHGGSIGIASRPAKGEPRGAYAGPYVTTVTVELPCLSSGN